MTCSGVSRIVVVFAAALVFTQAAWAARLTLQHGTNGYAGASDTWLDEGSPRDNYGADPLLEIRFDNNDGGFAENCMLVKFALPSVSFQTLASAVLDLFYLVPGSMQSDNAMGIKPYRVSPAKPWYENNRIGQSGEGASWRYFGREETEANKWTYEQGGWQDKIDDGNGTNRIKRPGGSAPGAIEPTNWVSFTVTPTVSNWLSGATNNGFILFSCSFEGGGTEIWGKFASRETNEVARRPRLRLQFQAAHVVWTGGVSGVWDTSTTNWLVGGFPGVYDVADHVRFTDGTARTNVTLGAGNLSPGSVTISNHARHLTFSGASLGGTGTVRKVGTGTALLTSSNHYTGRTIVEGGVLAVSTNIALGSTAEGTSVSNGATLLLQGPLAYVAAEPLDLAGSLQVRTGTNVWAGPITLAGPSPALEAWTGSVLRLPGAVTGASGALSVRGGGRVELQGSGTYTGGTRVTDATLWVNGWDSSPTGPGTVTVEDGGTLGGTGRVAGAVQVEAGGTLSPGLSIGTLTLQGGLTLGAGSTLRLEAGASVHDGVDLAGTGSLTLHTNAALDIVGTLPGTNAIWLVSKAAGVTGFFQGLPEGAALPAPNDGWHIHYQPNGVFVSKTSRLVWYFRGLDNQGQALLMWRTVTEVGATGFDVYRQQDGEWVRLNAKPLPAQYPGGGYYEFADPYGPSPELVRYRLIQNLSGGMSNELINCERLLTDLRFLSVTEPSRNRIKLGWQSRPDEVYWLMTTTNWQEPFVVHSGPITSVVGQTSVVVSNTEPVRFYQVILPP